MSLLSFATQDELDGLDEDNQVAFMQLVAICQRSLATQTSQLNASNESEWEQIEELRHSFMNVVIAAAKRFEIEPFCSMDVPTYHQFRNKIDHREFRSDLDHYVTQIMLRNSERNRKDSVAIIGDTKKQILTYVSGLRQCIDASMFDEQKRKALSEKLDAFEIELAKKRTSIFAVARISFELLSIPGSMWASYEVAHKLIQSLSQSVAEAKASEPNGRDLPRHEAPGALSPPRSISFGRQKEKEPSNPMSRMSEIDDDIPF